MMDRVLDRLKDYFVLALDFAGEEDAGAYKADCIIAAAGKVILMVLRGFPLFNTGYIMPMIFFLLLNLGVVLPFMAATIRRANTENRSKLWCVTILFLPWFFGPPLNWLVLGKDKMK